MFYWVVSTVVNMLLLHPLGIGILWWIAARYGAEV